MHIGGKTASVQDTAVIVHQQLQTKTTFTHEPACNLPLSRPKGNSSSDMDNSQEDACQASSLELPSIPRVGEVQVETDLRNLSSEYKTSPARQHRTSTLSDLIYLNKLKVSVKKSYPVIHQSGSKLKPELYLAPAVNEMSEIEGSVQDSPSKPLASSPGGRFELGFNDKKSAKNCVATNADVDVTSNVRREFLVVNTVNLGASSSTGEAAGATPRNRRSPAGVDHFYLRGANKKITRPDLQRSPKAFVRYSRAVRPDVAAQFPDQPSSAVSARIVHTWRKMTAEEQATWSRQALDVGKARERRRPDRQSQPLVKRRPRQLQRGDSPNKI
ncbi:uncharacterized protein LOC108681970 [Hyalella azteca]|uniref:Uncharacterized protein LOC108681970 n=1 Tax=Hyalella azteca TaxID=294128 RepID=A0A8B7PK45_HYAAZ|nr:uncharacterized protein LOC108681970 [Hyalella azteca]